MKHHAVTGEHDLRGVARAEVLQHRGGDAGAHGFVLRPLIRTLRNRVGHLVDDMVHNIFGDEWLLRVHGGLDPGSGECGTLI